MYLKTAGTQTTFSQMYQFYFVATYEVCERLSVMHKLDPFRTKCQNRRLPRNLECGYGIVWELQI